MTPPDDKPGAREFWIEDECVELTGGNCSSPCHVFFAEDTGDLIKETGIHVIEFSAYEAVCKERDGLRAEIKMLKAQLDMANFGLLAMQKQRG